MKKSIIAAGAASAVLAAMPVLGTFAADVMQITDTIQVNVTTSCTMDDDGNATTDPSLTGHTYTGSGAAGTLVTLNASGGTATSFTVECNDADGYTITPTFTALKINGLEGAANAEQDIPYGSAINNATQAQRAWTAYYSKNSGSETAFANSTAVNGTPSMTDTYAFSYKVGLGADQAAGTYTGTATYQLANK